MRTGVVYNIQRMSGQDGPGLRTTVFLKGCPLRCLWCSNPESQSQRPQVLVFRNLCVGCGACAPVCPHQAVQAAPDGTCATDRERCAGCGRCAAVCPHKAREIAGREMTVEEVLREIGKDELFYRNSGGGVTFGGGEPTASGDFLLELMAACRDRGYHVCLDTCGHCEPERFAAAAAAADLLLFDCKHMDPDAHRRLTGADNRLILGNLRAALERGIPLRVRVPLMPGLNDTEANIAALAAFLKPYGKTEVDILPCHTFGSSKYEALGLAQPEQVPYPADALCEVRALFARHGLRTVLV